MKDKRGKNLKDTVMKLVKAELMDFNCWREIFLSWILRRNKNNKKSGREKALKMKN